MASNSLIYNKSEEILYLQDETLEFFVRKKRGLVVPLCVGMDGTSNSLKKSMKERRKRKCQVLKDSFKQNGNLKFRKLLFVLR
jgi:hypothetical protein